MGRGPEDNWGAQLDQLLKHGDYRDFSHLHALEQAGREAPYGSLLDVGCGTASLVAQAAAQGAFAVGMDYSRALIDHHRKSTRLPIVMADVQCLPVREASFDLVVCHGLLEHLPDPGAGARELLRAVRPGGRLLVSVPARWGLFPCLVPIWFFTGGRWRQGWRNMVGRMYTGAGFRRLLQENGADVQRLHKFKASSFVDWAHVPFHKPVAERLERSGLVQAVFGTMLLAVCRRREG
jgi:SAM-dependent methyltransferase